MQGIQTRSEQAPWDALAAGIVMRAVYDYGLALNKTRRIPDDLEALHTIREVERFFRGEWFHHLTTLDGNLIIGYMKQRRKGGRK